MGHLWQGKRVPLHSTFAVINNELYIMFCFKHWQHRSSSRDGLVGYDAALTQLRSRVRFSVFVALLFWPCWVSRPTSSQASFALMRRRHILFVQTGGEGTRQHNSNTTAPWRDQQPCQAAADTTTFINTFDNQWSQAKTVPVHPKRR